MAKPIIELLDSTHTNAVENWDIGEVKASNSSSVLEVNVWNNKGGVTDVSDLREAYVTCLDGNGGITGDVPLGKWMNVLVDSTADIDATTGEKVYTAIGGPQTAPLRGQAVEESFGNAIKGTANTGVAADSGVNYCNCKFRVDVPINANQTQHAFKLQVKGFSV